MKRRAKLLLTIVFSASCVGWVLPQVQAPATLDAVVTDVSGKIVADLGQDAFTLTEGGEAREIRSFYGVDAPWNVILLFDHNLTWLQADGRLNTRNYAAQMWRSLAQGSSQFMGSLKAQDKIAIASFENTVEIMLDWRKARGGQIQEIPLNTVLEPPKGEKDLYGALRWAIGKFQGIAGRKAVVIFTDGRDGRLTPQWLANAGNEQEVIDPLFGVFDKGEAEEYIETMESARENGVRLYFLAVNSTRAPDFRGRPINNLFPGAKQAVANYLAKVRIRLDKLAQASGGLVFYGDQPEAVVAEYARLYQDLQLASRYTIEYTSSQKASDSQKPVEVRVRDKNLKVFHSRLGR